MTQETDARQTLTSKRDKANASIPGLEKDVAKAIEGIAAVPKGSPPQAYVDAAGVLGTAQALLEGAQGDIRRATKGLDALGRAERIEAVSGVLVPARKSVGDRMLKGQMGYDGFPFPVVLTGNVAVESLPDGKVKQELMAADIKTLACRLDTGERLWDVKPSGAGLRGPTGGGGGGGKKNSWQYEGETFTSEELCREYADEGSVAKVDDAKAAGKSVSFAHLAESTANRIGAVKTEA